MPLPAGKNRVFLKDGGGEEGWGVGVVAVWPQLEARTLLGAARRDGAISPCGSVNLHRGHDEEVRVEGEGRERRVGNHADDSSLAHLKTLQSQTC